MLFAAATSAQRAQPIDLDTTLALVGEAVERYYARARTLVCLETVKLLPLGPDFMLQGRERRLVSELRVSWEPAEQPDSAPEAQVLRSVLTIDGRPPRPGDEPGCLDPKAITPEPLSILLPGIRQEYYFSLAGTERLDRRNTVRIDYRPRTPRPVEVTWGQDSCFNVSVQTAGRIWADAVTGDVLRLDERLPEPITFEIPRERTRAGLGGSMRLERVESSIRYRPVGFRNPDETLMLPVSAEAFSVLIGSGVPRLRTESRFSDWKRFLASGRIVPN
jgi:hypothetical protein